MITTNKINVFLHENGPYQIDAVQGDTARVLELALYAGSEEWTIPDGTCVQIRFHKPDGTGGIYDTLPNGKAAFRIEGNRVLCALAPQVLTVSGEVEAQVLLIWSDGEVATFTILIRVQKDPSVGTLESEDFVNLSEWVSSQVKNCLEEDKEELREIFANPSPYFVHVYGGNSDTGYVANKTYEEIAAVAPSMLGTPKAERPVYCVLWDSPLTVRGLDYHILPLSSHDPYMQRYIFTCVDASDEVLVEIGASGVNVLSWKLVRSTQLPETLPSPYALTINGTVYDGSEAVNIEISGGSGEAPYIGSNGNWWIGEEDTGVKAAGEDGRSVYSVELDASQSDESKSVYSMSDDGDRTIGSFTVYHGKDGGQGEAGPQGPQGEKGDTGAQGPKGADGADGYTPQKGVDYFTEEDKAELTASLSQIEAPRIVSSVAEMTDIIKHYVLDGYIYSNKTIVTEGEIASPNLFDPSTATLNKRLSGSSGSESTSAGYFLTDFIPVTKYAETTPYNVRLNWKALYVADSDEKVLFYSSSKSKIGYVFLHEQYNATVSDNETVVDIKTMGGTHVEPTASEVAYVRFQLAVNSSLASLASADIANLEITFDANNVAGESTTKTEWVNSGIPYAPTFQTDLIGVLGEDNVIYLSENLPSGTYTLKYGDETYDTIGTITIE